MGLELATINEMEVRDFQPQEQTMLEQVKGFQVIDVPSMDCAGIILNSIKAMLDKRDEVFDPIIKANQETKAKADKARAVAVAKKEEHCKVLKECKVLLLGKIQNFRAAEQRKADTIYREEQLRLQKIEEEKRLKEAQRLEAAALELKKTSPDAAKKMQEEAERVLGAPIITEVVRPVEVTKPAGYMEKNFWKARVTNASKVDPCLKTHCKTCGTFVPDMVLLNRMATTFKKGGGTPEGVEYYIDTRAY